MKHIHIVGICGKASSGVAKIFYDAGWKVTGSEAKSGGWGPVADFLEGLKIRYPRGYAEENISQYGDSIDLVVQGGGAWVQWPNPEIEWANSKGITVLSTEDVLKKYVIKSKSIVVSGTYGKTTKSALITWILESAGKNPSFMVGDILTNMNISARNTDSAYSVMEGDEHPTLKYKDEKSKFFYMKPKFTIISSARWDHINIFPKEEQYIEVFKKLALLTAKNKGTLLLNAYGENLDKVKKVFKGKVYKYALQSRLTKKILTGNIDYVGEFIAFKGDRTVFRVYENKDLLWEFETSLFGEYNIENCTAAIAMARILNIDLKFIDKGIKTFSGAKRRMEFRGFSKTGAIIIDDLAHSPIKVKAGLAALRLRYPDKKIISVFDPHASSLQDKRTLKWYINVFNQADFVIIPKVKVRKSIIPGERVHGMDIRDAISKTQPNVEYIPSDEKIIEMVLNKSGKHSVVVFMSSGNWRGIIEKVLK